MIADGIDPRDIEWEIKGSTYRVYFWHRPAAPVDVPHDLIGFHSDEYRLREATDVGEVLDWARATARPDQTYVVYLEHHDGDSPGLILLMGTDPTVPT